MAAPSGPLLRRLLSIHLRTFCPKKAANSSPPLTTCSKASSQMSQNSKHCCTRRHSQRLSAIDHTFWGSRSAVSMRASL